MVDPPVNLNGGKAGAYAAVGSRISNRVQLTTDGHRVYADAVEDAFGSEIDFRIPDRWKAIDIPNPSKP